MGAAQARNGNKKTDVKVVALKQTSVSEMNEVKTNPTQINDQKIIPSEATEISSNPTPLDALVGTITNLKVPEIDKLVREFACIDTINIDQCASKNTECDEACFVEDACPLWIFPFLFHGTGHILYETVAAPPTIHMSPILGIYWSMCSSKHPEIEIPLCKWIPLKQEVTLPVLHDPQNPQIQYNDASYTQSEKKTHISPHPAIEQNVRRYPKDLRVYNLNDVKDRNHVLTHVCKQLHNFWLEHEEIQLRKWIQAFLPNGKKTEYAIKQLVPKHDDPYVLNTIQRDDQGFVLIYKIPAAPLIPLNVVVVPVGQPNHGGVPAMLATYTKRYFDKNDPLLEYIAVGRDQIR